MSLVTDSLEINGHVKTGMSVNPEVPRNKEKPEVRVGVIGIGLRGQHSYEQILKNDPRVRIIGVSSYPGASDILAEDHAGPEYHRKYAADLKARYYDDYRKLLEDDIDLVALMCEPSRALELGKSCIDAGKHVLRDKPMTKYAYESIELANYAKTKEKLLILAMPLRYYPVLKEVHNKIQAGQIGELTAVTMAYIWTNGPLAGFTPSIDYVKAYGAGDVLTAGYHAIDYLNWLIGAKPVSVYSQMNTFFYDNYRELGMEDFGQISLRYENKVIANLMTGRCTAKRSAINFLDISGTAGAIDVRDFRGHVEGACPEFQNIPYDNDPLSALTGKVVDAVLTGELDELANGYDGAMNSLVLEAARKSARTRKEELI